MKLFHLLLPTQCAILITAIQINREFEFIECKKDLYQKSANETIFRLSKQIKPESYNLIIKTEVDQGVKFFSGKVQIIVNAECIEDNFYLHAKNLEITKSELWKIADDKEIEVPILKIECVENLADDVIRIVIGNDTCFDGKYRLKLEYKSVLRDDLLGFYVSSYTNLSGKNV